MLGRSLGCPPSSPPSSANAYRPAIFYNPSSTELLSSPIMRHLWHHIVASKLIADYLSVLAMHPTSFSVSKSTMLFVLSSLLAMDYIFLLVFIIF